MCKLDRKVTVIHESSCNRREEWDQVRGYKGNLKFTYNILST